jgi:hypothetical protein
MVNLAITPIHQGTHQQGEVLADDALSDYPIHEHQDDSHRREHRNPGTADLHKHISSYPPPGNVEKQSDNQDHDDPDVSAIGWKWAIDAFHFFGT